MQRFQESRGGLPAAPRAVQAGFIKVVLLIVIALIVLGYFGYNLKDIINSPTVHDNLVYVWNLIVKLWNNILAEPAAWIWDKIQTALSSQAAE